MKFVAVLVFFLCVQPVCAAENAAFTPLIEAVTKENTSPYAIETLIENGENVNAVDDQGRTALMLAAMYIPDPLAVYVLINHGAKVNAKTPDTGKTALFFALQYNKNPKVILTLLGNGADQDIKDVFGRTAYDYADRNSKLKNDPVLSLFHAYHMEDTPPSSVSETSR